MPTFTYAGKNAAGQKVTGERVAENKQAGGQACCLDCDDFSQGEVWQRSVIAALNPTVFEEWKSWIRARQ